ncbi:MAG: hypothetical protein ACREBS_06250 [Nitrososphaerales archaeon]
MEVDENSSSSSNDEVYDVEVAMKVSKSGKEIETKRVNFGKLKEAQVKGLADLFSMMAANVEYIKKLTPQFEKLDKSKPAYLQ